MFVSRLRPETTAAELRDCVDTVKGDVSVLSVTCNSLKSKYAHLRSSYHVAVSVDAMSFAKASTSFTSPEAWPNGVLISRYFKSKHGGNNAK